MFVHIYTHTYIFPIKCYKAEVQSIDLLHPPFGFAFQLQWVSGLIPFSSKMLIISRIIS